MRTAGEQQKQYPVTIVIFGRALGRPVRGEREN